MNIFLFLLISYIAGSVHFALVILPVISKNNNSLISNRKKYEVISKLYKDSGILWTLIVILLELVKAIVIVSMADMLFKPYHLPWVILSYILGNRFPVFHSFNGGKGVAVYMALVLYLSPVYALLGCLAWVIAFVFTRQPFICSFFMTVLLSFGVVKEAEFYKSAILGVGIIFLLLTVNHFENIRNYFSSLSFINRDK